MASKTPPHELSRREKMVLVVPLLLWLVIGVGLYVVGVIGLMSPAVIWSLLAIMDFALVPAMWLAARRVIVNWWAVVMVILGLGALFNAAGKSGWAGLATSCACICILVALFRDPSIRERLDLW